MGLIQRAKDAIMGTLKDQFHTVIRCDNIDNDILMEKKTTDNNIIRNGSAIIVNPGQMAVIIDNGKVVDASAEAGTYEWQSDASASFFAGNFGSMFGEMWRRFTFGGGTFQDQAVYFINVKEILDNKFGTPAPVMYLDWQHSTLNAHTGKELPMQVKMTCTGKYTFMVDQPWEFLKRIGGTAYIYPKKDLIDQMRSEIVEVFQAVLNSLSKEPHRVPPGELSASALLIKDLMDATEFDTVIRKRGIKLEKITIETMQLTEDSEEKIKVYEATSNDRLMMDRQQDRMAETMQVVGSNEAGLGVGFLGLGMMNNVMGGAAGAGMIQQPMPQQGFPQQQSPMMQQPMQQMPQQPMQQASVPAQGGVACSNCGTAVAGPFCSQCGTAAPQPAVPQPPAAKFCSQCGAEAGGPFCTMCGAKQS